MPPDARASLDNLSRVLGIVQEENRAVDRRVTAAAADPIVVRLVTIARISPVLGLMIRAEIDDIGRFPTPKHLASYAGLVPEVEGQCGTRPYRLITKTG